MDERIQIISEGELGTRPSWDEIRMHSIIGFSRRASCYNVRSATTITADNHIIAEGYNGAPGLIEKNCLETGCRKENKGLDYYDSLNSGECIGVHSEMNATGHFTKLDFKDVAVYNTIFPCHTCAKILLSYKPARIIFKNPYAEKEMQSTLDLLEEAKIETYQLNMSPERYIDIAFNHPSVMFDVWSSKEKKRIKKVLESIRE